MGAAAIPAGLRADGYLTLWTDGQTSAGRRHSLNRRTLTPTSDLVRGGFSADLADYLEHQPKR
jgi:hypothetical protein